MAEVEPVPLVEDGDTGDRFLIYRDAAGVRIELRYAGDALWMTQAQIAELFGGDVSVISRLSSKRANSTRMAICRKCKLLPQLGQSHSTASM